MSGQLPEYRPCPKQVIIDQEALDDLRECLRDALDEAKHYARAMEMATAEIERLREQAECGATGHSYMFREGFETKCGCCGVIRREAK